MAKVTQLRLTPDNTAGLIRICQIDGEKLVKAQRALTANTRPLFRTSDLVKLFTQSGMDEDSAKLLARHLASLKRLALKHNISAAETVVALNTSVLKSDKLKDVLTRWQSIMPTLETMLAEPLLGLLAKAIDLYYDHGALMNETRVITDLRPLFDEKRATVVGALIFSTLKIDYAVTEGTRTIEVAIDLKDIDQLSEQLATAKQKTLVLQKLMKDRLSLDHAVFSGDE